MEIIINTALKTRCVFQPICEIIPPQVQGSFSPDKSMTVMYISNTNNNRNEAYNPLILKLSLHNIQTIIISTAGTKTPIKGANNATIGI